MEDPSDVSKGTYSNQNIECLKSKKGTKEYNVLFIVVDAMRADSIQVNYMPNTFNFQNHSISFNEHYSGSNETRGGIFSLFYGILALYFKKMKSLNVESSLIHYFRNRGYEFGIYPSAPLTMPEFDQTVFSKLPHLRLKSNNQMACDRDNEITDEWLNFTKNRDKAKPFFSVFYFMIQFTI